MLVTFIKNHTPYMAGETAKFDDSKAAVLIEKKRVAVPYVTKPMVPGTRPQPESPDQGRPPKEADAPSQGDESPDDKENSGTEQTAAAESAQSTAPAAMRAVHRGRGKWAVVGGEDQEIASGLTKEEAQAVAAGSAPVPPPAESGPAST